MFSRRVAQLLHDDHQETIRVIEGLDDLLARARRAIPDTADPRIRKALDEASGVIRDEVGRHFAFEEDALFPLLEEMGDVAIGAHLRAEHAALLPLGEEVARLAGAALEGGFTAEGWTRFRDAAAELVERMMMHVQKEEMALLPALDDLLDDAADMDLSTRYANDR